MRYFKLLSVIILMAGLTACQKEILYEEQNEPKNAFSGIYQGICGFGTEIGRGVFNLFTQPCENYSSNGMTGFCSGLCKGLVGFILCPISATLKLVSSISDGIKNSCFGISGRNRLKKGEIYG